MTFPRRRVSLSGGVLASLVALTLSQAAPALAAVPVAPTLVTIGQAAEQDVPALPGSEPDTLVEPDVAVSPLNPLVAVAVAHDGRYPDGGAVGISYAWTADGGRHWEHHPLPGVTATTGGPAVWERASDPVLAFDADGSVYASVLLFNSGCDTAVTVSRSTDGGRTFGAPVYAHRSPTCDVSDDKNTLVVDNSPRSPHRGRLYQFWTPFLTDSAGNADGSPQYLVWSDDHGASWSAPVAVSPPHANTQNSAPMLRPDGVLIDSYLDYGPNGSAEGSEAEEARHEAAKQAATAPTAAAVQEGGPDLVTRISTDGGATWSDGTVIAHNIGQGPAGIRCCLPSATADPVTGRMFVAWNGSETSQVLLARSDDGLHWSKPRQVNPTDSARESVNVDVSAYRGTVAVSYGMVSQGRFAQQYLATSTNGEKFTSPLQLGPTIDYAFAAQAFGIFPGDYIGTAMQGNTLYAVWCVSSQPASATAQFHQVEYAANLEVVRHPHPNRSR